MEKHWVEELFPPHYIYLHDDGGTSPGVDKQLASIAENVDTHDTTTSIKPKPKDKEESDRLQRTKVEELYEKVGEPLAEHLPKKSPSTEAKPEKVKKCIWTNKELQILRRATEATKRENLRLRAELGITTKHSEKLQQKSKRQVAAATAKDAELLETRQAAERLSHRCHHLENELEQCRATVKYLEQDVDELKESKSRLKNQLKSLQHEHSTERLARVKVGRALKEAEKRNVLESIVREDGIRIDYERQIKRLQDELQEVVAELAGERKQNVSATKALDHLRIHFASFPSSSEQVASTLSGRRNNELGKFDLY